MSMQTAVQPRSDFGTGSDAADFVDREHAPRSRVDSGHVVDGDGVIRRVPKLAVRNRTSDESNGTEQGIATYSDAGSERERSAPVSSNSSQRVRTPLSHRSISSDSVHDRSQSGRQRPSGESYKSTNTVIQPAAKKKRGGFVSFLTLKEPSTSAWAEFAEAEKEKARQKQSNGSSPVTRQTNLSTQRLPDHVPKVNSKWDGLPETAHRQSNESRSGRKANRNSLISNATRDTIYTSHSTVSGDSKMTKRALVSPSGKMVRDSMSSQGSRRQPPALALEFDPNMIAEHVENTEENLPQTFLRDPSPPPHLPELPDSTVPISPPELEGDDGTYFQELEASPPHSPRTPPADGTEGRPALVGVHYPELDSIAKEAELLGDTKQDAVIRANSSRRPVNFSRPQLKMKNLPPPFLSPIQPSSPKQRPKGSATSPSATNIDGVLLSPNMMNPGGEVEPFLTDTFASHSRETGHIPQRAASTLVKTPTIEEANPGAEEEEEEEPPVSPISPVSPLETPFQPSSVPDVSMRPPTAASTASTISRPATYQPTRGDATRNNQARYEPTRSESPRTPLESESQLSLVESVAPSELSEHWRMSPKERLGLGSRLRKSAVSPWEAEDEAATLEGRRSPGLARLSPLPSPGVDGKKRMSWRSIGGKK